MTIHNPPYYVPRGWPRLYYWLTNLARRLDMRIARLFFLAVIMAVLGRAQVTNPYQIRINTPDVSGSCPSPYFFSYNPVSGNLFGCKGGTWTQISGGGGGSGVSDFTGDSVVYNNSASTGSVTLSLIAQVKNLVFAGPSSGSNATPTFRALVGADLPNPSATTLGGIESLAAVSHKWINTISTAGVPAATQPACGDLSDSATGCSATSLPPNGTAGGDLSGSYPNPTVAQVNGATVPASAKLAGINSSSQIIAAALTSAHLYVGSAGNLPVDVAVSGDVTLVNTGAFTVAKVNGVSYGSGPSTNTVPVVTGSNTVTYEAVPNAALANSSIVFANGTGISGGATVSLGGTYTPAVTANTRSRAIGAGWDGGGSALTTTGSTAYFFVPFACTITKWAGTVDTGTITWDIWKIASGTAIPTISNTITASALPAISTGTALASTSMSGWTTTVTAYDIFGFTINTVASATKSSLILECDTSS